MGAFRSDFTRLVLAPSNTQLPGTILVAPGKRRREVATQQPLEQSQSGVQPMFSRKRSETEDRKMADSYSDPRIPMTQPRPAGAATTAPVRPLAMPPQTSEPARAADPVRPADSPLRLIGAHTRILDECWLPD